MVKKFVVPAVATVAALWCVAAPVLAQDIFNGGRFAGGSSDAIKPLTQNVPELPEIAHKVDLQRYSGMWYQVAAIPQPYTLMCSHDTTAQYTVLNQDSLGVVNSCGTIAGNSRIDGVATTRGDATLRVDFSGIPFQSPTKPDNYRVTYLADDYSLAIVGSPNRTAGFVLSRTPSLSPAQWELVRTTIEDRGWWSCAFISTPMAGGRGDATPLCVKR